MGKTPDPNKIKVCTGICIHWL